MKKNILIGVAVCIIALILGTILVKKKITRKYCNPIRMD